MNVFLSQLIAELDTASKDLFEQDLSTDELTKALHSVEKNKIPGEDGLPKELYVTFWDQLKDPLLDV